MDEKELIKKYVSKDKQEEALKKIEENYPVQYIIGDVDFYNCKIKVNESVLIPRFETELLVDKTIKYLKELFKEKKFSIADLGTGSGAIAISLKKSINCDVTAFDISDKALNTAKENTILNNQKIEFVKADIRKPIPGKYDCIISNPPYIKKGDMVADPVKYEPSIALYALDEGLEFYKKIFSYIKENINKKSLLAFEFGLNQEKELYNIAKETFPCSKILIEKDLTGVYRFLFIINE